MIRKTTQDVNFAEMSEIQHHNFLAPKINTTFEIYVTTNPVESEMNVQWFRNQFKKIPCTPEI